MLEAGLPNVTASTRIYQFSGWDEPWATNGAFSVEKTTGGFSAYHNNAADIFDTDLKFDASESSSFYGNSVTVQPPALTTNYVIKY